MIDKGIKRTKKLEQELSANWNGYTLQQSLQKLYEIREIGIDINQKLIDAMEFFENPENLYQFLDKPTKKLF